MKTLVQLAEVGCFFLSLVAAIFQPQYAIWLIGVAIWLNLANK